jgi:hypothetical protein
LREKLTAALDENPAPTLARITEGLGYKDQSSLRDRRPDLYYALRERRQVCLKERKESLERTLKAALIEEPPPTIKTIT